MTDDMTDNRDTMKPERIQIRDRLAEIPDWSLTPDGLSLRRFLPFRSMFQWATFMFALSILAHSKRLKIKNECLRVTLWILPMDEADLTEKEVNFARRLDRLAQKCEQELGEDEPWL